MSIGTWEQHDVCVHCTHSKKESIAFESSTTKSRSPEDEPPQRYKHGYLTFLFTSQIRQANDLGFSQVMMCVQ
jgi:hypothetical protein